MHALLTVTESQNHRITEW